MSINVAIKKDCEICLHKRVCMYFNNVCKTAETLSRSMPDITNNDVPFEFEIVVHCSIYDALLHPKRGTAVSCRE